MALIRGRKHKPANPPGGRRGRGALSNESGRYERERRIAAPHDGPCGHDPDATAALPKPIATRLHRDASRRVLVFNRSPDIPFDRSINPYRGCEHGCIYCFARPTHAYLGLSPGLDFETELFFKPDAPALLRRELAQRNYVCRPIAIGTNTDAYQPAERRLQIMRGLLEVLDECNHPLAIVTKSDLILRDKDILSAMASRGLVRVAISLTSLDHRLSRLMEPRASAPRRRLAAIGELAAAGVPVIAMLAPVIPALNDEEIEAILQRAAQSGATAALWVLLRLPHEVKDLFRQWLQAHFPDRARRIENQIRACRGGALYDSRFFHRLRGHGPFADLIARRFSRQARRLGLDRAPPALRTDLFQPPRPSDEDKQLSLF